MAAGDATAFFVLDYDVSDRSFTTFSPEDPVHLGQAPRCPECGLFVGMMPWHAPRTASLKQERSEWADLVFRGPSSILVSDRFVHAYGEAGLVGLAPFEQIQVSKISPRKAAGSVPRYAHTSALASKAVIDDEASGCKRSASAKCKLCKSSSIEEATGLKLVDGSWSGEDIFVAWGFPGRSIVTARFRNVWLENRFQGLKFEPLDSYQLPRTS